MALGIYAGNAADSLTLLPSPVSIKPSHEIIWSENTGRAQSGANKAKMIGDVIAEKQTYTIQWGLLTQSEYNTVKNKLKAGFFYFAVAASASQAEENAAKYYRGNLTAEAVQAGNSIYYKDATVSVIEQ